MKTKSRLVDYSAVITFIMLNINNNKMVCMRTRKIRDHGLPFRELFVRKRWVVTTNLRRILRTVMTHPNGLFGLGFL